MKKLLTITVALFIFNVQLASSSELKAIELSQYCAEVTKGLTGNALDHQLAQQCKGYMAGFFDSMIIIEKVTGKKEFCIPRVLPKTQNNMILKSWIDQNKEVAPKTTAAVALYSAFKTAFPCR